MNEDPSHPPTRNQPALGQAAAGEDRNAAAERSHGWAVAAWEDLAKEVRQLKVSVIAGTLIYEVFYQSV